MGLDRVELKHIALHSIVDVGLAAVATGALGYLLAGTKILSVTVLSAGTSFVACGVVGAVPVLAFLVSYFALNRLTGHRTASICSALAIGALAATACVLTTGMPILGASVLILTGMLVAGLASSVLLRRYPIM